MHEVIIEQFHHHLKTHYPELEIAMSQKGTLSNFLQQCMNHATPYLDALRRDNTPEHQVTEMVLEAMTQALGPSRYDYLESLLFTKYASWAAKLKSAGILRFEILNLLHVCQPLFVHYGFDDPDKENFQFDKAVTKAVLEYRLSSPK